MTLAVLASRAIAGWQAPAVRVETHLGSGLPALPSSGCPTSRSAKAANG